MKHFSAFCLSVAVCFGACTTVKAQGTGDPGLSSIGGLRSAATQLVDEDIYENNLTHFGVSHTFAKGDRDVVLNIPQVELSIPIEDFGYIETKLPFYAVKGDLAKVTGIGDLSVAYTHFMPYADGFSWQFTGGLSIGTGTATKHDGKNRALPMVYQSTHGTTDVILGVNVQYKQYVSFAVGYQQPIIRYNENDYNRSTPINELLYSNTDYPLSRKLYRNGDIMTRLEGHLTSKRAGISAGPLAIYHLRTDLYQDINNKYRNLVGSDGLSVNLAGSFFYRLGRYAQWKFDAYAAFPMVQRDLHPDGSNRQWVFMPRITYFFNQETLIF